MTVFLVLLIEFVGMGRYYFIFDDLRFSYECIGTCTFLAFGDLMCFSGMFRAKSADPGYLMPPDKKKNDEVIADDIEMETLKKDNKQKTDDSDSDEDREEHACTKCGY